MLIEVSIKIGRCGGGGGGSARRDYTTPAKANTDWPPLWLLITAAGPLLSFPAAGVKSDTFLRANVSFWSSRVGALRWRMGSEDWHACGHIISSIAREGEWERERWWQECIVSSLARGTEGSVAALALGISLRFCQIAPVNVPLLSRSFSGNFRPFRGKHTHSDTSERRLLALVTFSHTTVNKSHQSTVRVSFFPSFFFFLNEWQIRLVYRDQERLK